MADLPGGARHAAEELSAEDYAGADLGADRHEDLVPVPFARAVFELPEGLRVGVVVDLDADGEAGLEPFAEREACPAGEIGHGNHHAVPVAEVAGSPHANAIEGPHRQADTPQEVGDKCRDVGHHLVRALSHVVMDRFFDQEAPIGRNDAESQLGPSDIHTTEHRVHGSSYHEVRII